MREVWKASIIEVTFLLAVVEEPKKLLLLFTVTFVGKLMLNLRKEDVGVPFL